MTKHKKDNSWVTQTEELQWNCGTHTPRNSNIFHMQNLMNITINLAKDDHQVMKLCLAHTLPTFQH